MVPTEVSRIDRNKTFRSLFIRGLTLLEDVLVQNEAFRILVQLILNPPDEQTGPCLEREQLLFLAVLSDQ